MKDNNNDKRQKTVKKRIKSQLSPYGIDISIYAILN